MLCLGWVYSLNKIVGDFERSNWLELCSTEVCCDVALLLVIGRDTSICATFSCILVSHMLSRALNTVASPCFGPTINQCSLL